MLFPKSTALNIEQILHISNPRNNKVFHSKSIVNDDDWFFNWKINTKDKNRFVNRCLESKNGSKTLLKKTNGNEIKNNKNKKLIFFN